MARTINVRVLASAILAGVSYACNAVVAFDEKLAKKLHEGGHVDASPEAVAYCVEELKVVPITHVDPKDAVVEQRVTRASLDAALAALPGDYTDPDYVVNGMRRNWVDIFTDADEAKVRELVKASGSGKGGSGK